MVAFTEDVVKGQSPQSHEKDYVWHLQCLCPPSLHTLHPPIRGGGKEEEKREKMEGREEKKRKRKGFGFGFGTGSPPRQALPGPHFPPGRSLGFKSAKIKMQPRSKITMFLQSKASDKCEEFVVVECDVLRSVQVVVEVVVLDVERSCSKGEQRDEKGASRGTRKRRREKEEEKGEREKEKNIYIRDLCTDQNDP